MTYSSSDSSRIDFIAYILQIVGAISFLAAISSVLFLFIEWMKSGEWHALPWFDVLFSEPSKNTIYALTDIAVLKHGLVYLMQLEIYSFFLLITIITWVFSVWLTRDRRHATVDQYPGTLKAGAEPFSLDISEYMSDSDLEASSRRETYTSDLDALISVKAEPGPETTSRAGKDDLLETDGPIEGVLVDNFVVPDSRYQLTPSTGTHPVGQQHPSILSGFGKPYHQQSIPIQRRTPRITAIALLLSVVAVVAWWVLVPRHPPISAIGLVKISTQHEEISNLAPGEVREIYFREGDVVAEGDSLMRLSGYEHSEEIQNLERMILNLRIRQARLDAEKQVVGSIELPPELLSVQREPAILHLLSNEQSLLDTNRKAYVGETSTLRSRIAKDIEELAKLRLRDDVTRRALNDVQKRLGSASGLLEQGVVYDNGSYIGALYQELITKASELKSTAAGVREKQKILEQQIQKVSKELEQLHLQHHNRIDEAYTDTNNRIFEIRDRIDSLKRDHRVYVLRSPFDGTVSRIKDFRVGDRLLSNTPILGIQRPIGPLQIEVPLQAHDAETVSLGSEAFVTLKNLSNQNESLVIGNVSGISANSAPSGDFEGKSSVYVEISGDTMTSARVKRPRSGSKVEVRIEPQDKIGIRMFLSSLI